MDLIDGMSAPVRRAWVRSLTTGRAAMTRRSLLRGSALAASGAVLAACGIPGTESGAEAGESRTRDYSESERELNFSNWPLYIDQDDDNENVRPTLERFEQETGITVNYTEDINDNNEFFARIRPQLAAGQDTGRDLICVTDWMAGRLIRQGWAERLDQMNIPNAVRNLDAQYRVAAHDAGRQFCYPWSAFSCVIGYNKSVTGGEPVTSVSQLLDDESLRGSVTLLTEMRETTGMVMLDMGADASDFTGAEFTAAIERIQGAVDSGQIRRFTGNDYINELNSGDIAACLAWSGDLIQLRYDNPDIDFYIPEAGYITLTDELLVPKGARHQANAEALINYYYQPAVAAELAAWINFACPVAGAQEEMRDIDPELAQNTLIFPDEAMAERGVQYRLLTDEEETTYEEQFARLIGA
ncbi:spermidine/putrescine ABC transporter substrate-binding protein [Streptomyces sp. 7-21]|jgi:spermidine/putrescine transport system substrate-binding protein|uniref:polyamine ABC transporter substrate-binding protein n=1 Tax=Streptomyces sp. 7-21 TaxID=2802283 RepID=UPI00191EBD69|nr:spermidine/putrescine ABC transporter substrate-binding protein [Streptomyces sp. 7-21]MBL1068351.1 extracellular solute-binding protein [Streptomyces sp. 7-21]